MTLCRCCEGHGEVEAPKSERRLEFEKRLGAFMANPSARSMHFPFELTSEELKEVHRIAMSKIGTGDVLVLQQVNP